MEPTVPSNYMQELTQYLSVNIDSVLLGLPTEIKELVYFDALSHAATMILVSSSSVPIFQTKNSILTTLGITSLLPTQLPPQLACLSTGSSVLSTTSPSTSLIFALTLFAKALPLDPSVNRISPAAVRTLANDVAHLSDFVNSLSNPILDENLDELRQTVSLMGTENPDEFFDVSLRNRKFGKVDNMNGPVLLEK